MDAKNLDFGKIVEAIQNEITMISATIKERTLNRFVRPIVISVALVFAAYYFVYSPPERKMLDIQRKIDSARITAQYADSYKDLHDQLLATYAQLPNPKDREHWITDSYLEALRQEGLIADSIVPPEEQVERGFAVQRVTVQLNAKFSEIYSLVRRLEGMKPSLHVVDLSITKGGKLEMNTISCTVGTMIPVKKGG